MSEVMKLLFLIEIFRMTLSLISNTCNYTLLKGSVAMVVLPWRRLDTACIRRSWRVCEQMPVQFVPVNLCEPELAGHNAACRAGGLMHTSRTSLLATATRCSLYRSSPLSVRPLCQMMRRLYCCWCCCCWWWDTSRCAPSSATKLTQTQVKQH